MAFVDEKFNVRRMSHAHLLSGADTRSMLIGTLGSDFRHAIAPYTGDILELARSLDGNVHRAAMRLLLDFHGRRPTAMEQQLIIAALAELQGPGEAGSEAPFDRAAREFASLGDRRQLRPLQVDQALHP